MSTRSENAKCLLLHTRAEDAHDMAGTLATIHPEAVFEDQPVGLRLEGRQNARKHYELWWNAFGVQTENASLHWVNDDMAIGEADFVGTHKGSFLGIPATGLPIRFRFTVVVQFRDGLLSGERFSYDLNDILHQIGYPAFKVEHAA
ncbi:SnoaL-like polyketide cyclase [Sulfitobacter marinus]|uniref:SnoaL-like polyketide cyclase n=1 Tax=Sulfitobacter marinus TaxID=394264 RepID=A0A1I6V418_9RHOB|nr:ester cyclase [Sulfitobacter marinus]SFT08443.1 SnoaL-like polyketide cyclase [Sulfitobacter marinus]